jgi:RNA polymerase sigma-70 factor (ECF subfamily)
MLPELEIARIYDEHASSVFGLFMKFARDSSDARDLLQDWLVKIGRSDGLPDDLRNERSWCLKTAYRLAVDWSRKKGSHARTIEAFEDRPRAFDFFETENDPDRELIRLGIEEALSSLPRDQQLVATLKIWDELSFREIGEVLDISANTASSRYRYAVEKIRAELKNLYSEICEP